MKQLKLAQNMRLPIEAAGETILIVGKRGSGKSSTGTRFAEQFIRADVPIAVLDPVDVWWGLKAGRDGRRNGGLEVYVFGGDHADLPLEPTAGTLMADTIVDHRINIVMVLRSFSNREKARFVSDFAEQLYRRNRDTMHLFCEEAHEFMPQNPYAGEEEMLGRMLRLEKQGRTSGIGMTAITQRPASLNKNATTQAEILIAHRLLGPQDVKAIDGWIQHHHQQDDRQKVLSTLASLKTGEAWIWAPDFPEQKPMGLAQVRIDMPETFDSRRTPKPGERRRQPKELAPVDLEKIRAKMSATIERAKADDPKELRRKIVELQKHRCPEAKGIPQKTEIVKVPVLKDGHVSRFEKVVFTMDNEFERHVETMEATVEKFKKISDEILKALRSVGSPIAATHTMPSEKKSETRKTLLGFPIFSNSELHAPQTVDKEFVMGAGDKKVLIAVAQFPDGITTEHIAILTGYRATSRRTYLQHLSSRGYILKLGENYMPTKLGIEVLGPEFRPLPTGAELREHLKHSLPAGELKIFSLLLDRYPSPTSKEEIMEATGYKETSIRTYLQFLSARKLIEPTPGGIRLVETLF